MEKNLAFFRLFDVAFFIPGALFFAALWIRGWLKWIVPADADGPSGPVFAVVIAIIGSYMLGLFVHGVQRMVTRLVHVVLGPNNRKHITQLLVGNYGTAWYRNLSDDQRHELTTYFWYLRATCRNAAVALALSGFALYVNDGPLNVMRAAWLFAVAAVLIALGMEYDSSLNVATATTTVETNDKAGDGSASDSSSPARTGDASGAPPALPRPDQAAKLEDAATQATSLQAPQPVGSDSGNGTPHETRNEQQPPASS